MQKYGAEHSEIYGLVELQSHILNNDIVLCIVGRPTVYIRTKKTTISVVIQKCTYLQKPLSAQVLKLLRSTAYDVLSNTRAAVITLLNNVIFFFSSPQRG